MTTLSEQLLWPVPWGVAVAASLAAAWTDARTHRIPNSLTLPLGLLGVAWSTGAGGWAGLGESLLACVLVASPFVLLYAFAGGGAGDAKMMGALGAWLGLIGGAAALVTVTLAGGLLAVLYATARGKYWAVLANIQATVCGVAAMARDDIRHVATLRGESLRRPDVAAFVPSPRQMHPMPYGVAILAGVLIAAGGACLWRLH